MRIVPGDDLNVSIKKICEGDIGAGNIVVLLLREFPETTMDYLKAIDKRGLYGSSMADFYFRVCSGDLKVFLENISND